MISSARTWPRRCGLAAALVLGLLAAPAISANPGSISGMWWTGSGASHLAAAVQQPIPFTALGKKTYAANRKNIKNDRYKDRVDKFCLPEGVPRVMLSGYPFEIVTVQHMVLLRFEKHHSYRRVLLNETHPDPDDYEPTMLGDAIGRWEQDTLVIDTTGFKAHSALDSAGLPYGEKLHVVERLKRLDDGRLENLITVEDPEMYSRPWSATVTYVASPDTKLQEWICGDPHRILPGQSNDRKAPR